MKIKTMKDGVEVELEVAEVFETQEQFENRLRSENSKGKGEILKTLGVTSIDEAKSKMGAQTEVEKLTSEVKNLTNKLENETYLRYANEIGIKPELVQKTIILAKAEMGDGKDFKTILKTEAEAIGAIAKKEVENNTATSTKYGHQKTKEEIDLAKAEEEEMARLRELDPQAR